MYFELETVATEAKKSASIFQHQMSPVQKSGKKYGCANSDAFVSNLHKAAQASWLSGLSSSFLRLGNLQFLDAYHL